MVIVNPETKGPVGDSHLGEVCIIFTCILKSQQQKALGFIFWKSLKLDSFYLILNL